MFLVVLLFCFLWLGVCAALDLAPNGVVCLDVGLVLAVGLVLGMVVICGAALRVHLVVGRTLLLLIGALLIGPY